MFSKGHYPQNVHPYTSMTCFYLGINPFNWNNNPRNNQLEIFLALWSACTRFSYVSYFRVSPSQSNKIIEHVRVTLLVPTAVVEHMPCQEHILHEFLDTIRVPFDMFDGLTWLIQQKWMTETTEAMSQLCSGPKLVTIVLSLELKCLPSKKVSRIFRSCSAFPGDSHQVVQSAACYWLIQTLHLWNIYLHFPSISRQI